MVTGHWLGLNFIFYLNPFYDFFHFSAYIIKALFGPFNVPVTVQSNLIASTHLTPEYNSAVGAITTFSFFISQMRKLNCIVVK